MGTNQSIYEKPGTLDYYRFSAEEYALVKKVWSEIEINPQIHGSAYLRSFCKAYPQYVKFFTLELNLLTNFDACITTKFSVTIETMGYLLLDFNNRPKRLDRFVGYIAMVHKDMRLDEQDMCNLLTSLFEYLSQTYTAQMTSQCREAMSRFMDRIIKQLSIKMEAFRRYDDAQSGSTARSKSVSRKKCPLQICRCLFYSCGNYLDDQSYTERFFPIVQPWGQCPFFAEPMIFGKTKFYWDEWKKQWDERFNEWTTQATSFNFEETPAPIVSPSDEDTRINFDDENSILEPQTSTLIQKRRRISNESASKHPADMPLSRSRLRSNRLASADLSALVKSPPMADDKKTAKQFENESLKTAKPRNTARERRREHLKINLE